MIKLHLGCGQNILPGFINCDLYSKGDFISQIDAIVLPFKDSTVDVIYACHILEHFSRHEIVDVLSEWCRVLKKGGELYIAVPNFEAIANHYLKYHDVEVIQGLLNGGQDCDWNKHIVSFDFAYIKKCLDAAGFCDVSLYDYKDFDVFADHDDFSQAYLPHMDRENGTLMSLNIECKRR